MEGAIATDDRGRPLQGYPIYSDGITRCASCGGRIPRGQSRIYWFSGRILHLHDNPNCDWRLGRRRS